MWKKAGLVADGGSIFYIHSNQAGQTWLVSGAGILHKTEQGWTPIPQSRPLPSLISVSSTPSGNAWWAGSLTGELIRSRNEGQSWETCWLDQVTAPVVCMAVSPRYSTDHTVLAGTNGGGVLRSTDGGRRWFVSNFGFRDFTILTLTTATDWTRREVVFAGTLAGVYRSSGGGRAWKQVGLADMAVQALAVSYQFAENGLILAGTEQGLYRSVDGGKNWQPANGGLVADIAINALVSHHQAGQEIWWAGTDDGSLWQSTDGGQTWTNLLSGTNPVLALAASPEGLLAGLNDGGLLASVDGGQTWPSDNPVFGRSWQRLATAGDERLLAIAPNDGVWLSVDGGQTWTRTIEASLDRPLLAATALDTTWLAARIDGVFRREGEGVWRAVLASSEASIAALAVGKSKDDPMWAASIDCSLWRSDDMGVTWQAVDVPFAGQQLLALAIAPTDSTVLACSLDSFKKEVTLWRLAENANWEPWLGRPLTDPYAQVIAGGMYAERLWLVVGKEVWHFTSGEWQSCKVFDQTVRRAALNLSNDLLYVLAGQEIFCTRDGLEWISKTPPDEAAPVVDLQVLAEDKLLVLDIKGVLWQTSDE